jgi:hypothetical protein
MSAHGPRSGHRTLKARTLPHNLITRNKCWLGTLTLHGSPSRPRHPALMASVSPTLGPFLLNEFSVVVNIDQPRIGIWGKTGSIAVPNRQLSATERSVMLPPNTGKHDVIYPTKSTIQPRRDRNSSVFQVWQADALGLHRACSPRSRSPHLRVPGMQDDWAFCSRDLAATGPVLRPVGSGSDVV